MKYIPTDNVLESATHHDKLLIERSKPAIGTAFTQCFHFYVGCGGHMYIYSNSLVLEHVEPILNQFINCTEISRLLCEQDSSTRIVMMDCEMGHVNSY